AQCNDAYWHGVFGGLYAPHLRSGVLGRLIRGEEIMDRADANPPLQVAAEDFDMDGSQEVLLDQRCLNLVARPADGGTLSSLRFKPAAVELINSLARRREAYHQLVSQQAGGAVSSQLLSIHERSYGKDLNLAAMLRYDRYARHSFRMYLFPRHKGWQDFDSLQLEECGELAAGAWDLTQLVHETGYFELRKFVPADREGGRGSVRAVKAFTNR
ncbi:MAG: alpha-amylase/4-alpha-glucanotransferase domain-containing protein, partial [Terriglobia bacterium]